MKNSSKIKGGVKFISDLKKTSNLFIDTEYSYA